MRAFHYVMSDENIVVDSFEIARQKPQMLSSWMEMLLSHALAATAILLSSHVVMGGGCFFFFLTAAGSLIPFFTPVQLEYAPWAQTGAVQGVHVTLEGTDKIRVNWLNPAIPTSGPFSPQCFYGNRASNLNLMAEGFVYTYTAGMFNGTLNSAFLDIAKLVPCPPDSTQSCIRTIFYRCGDKAFGGSDIFQLELQDPTVPTIAGSQIAVVGDMGVPHGRKTIESIAGRIVQEDKHQALNDNSGGVQLLLHAGDISYANYYNKKTLNNSWVWVDYMATLQTVAARVPYMTSPGNHEFQFAAYLNWLPMPSTASNSSSPFWYSFDYMGVHVVAFSTEHDFSPNSTQYHWIAQDLERANGNRARVPWIVVMGHRPLYCSSLVSWKRCQKEALLYRSYLEKLLYQQRVDVVIAGHVHKYERSYPVYREVPTQKNYVNPQAPVYIINGAAGNPKLNDPTFTPSMAWRAAFEATFDTGFLLMTPSATSLAFQYVLSTHNKVVDSFTIERR